jgi:hypothetical protein
MQGDARVLDALAALLESGPGMRSEDYVGAPSAYRADRRAVQMQLADGRALLREVRVGLTLEESEVLHRAGRLETHWDGDGWVCRYHPGQYYATEYRAAVCRVLAEILRMRWFALDRPWRETARAHLGPGIARRWFA